MYHQRLLSSPKCLQYLRERKISLAVARVLEVGYFDLSQNSGYYDRMVFPVRSLFGEFVTFQGRAMYDWENSKTWDGQPDRKYYHGSGSWKPLNLHGLNYNAELIIKMGFVVIVEGPFDVAALLEAGIPAAAVLGARLSEFHCWLLRQLTDTVYIWLDGDAAGQKGAAYAKQLLTPWGINVKFLGTRLKDPAETLVSKGREYLRGVVLA